MAAKGRHAIGIEQRKRVDVVEHQQVIVGNVVREEVRRTSAANPQSGSELRRENAHHSRRIVLV